MATGRQFEQIECLDVLAFKKRLDDTIALECLLLSVFNHQ
jgi:hypothetical protein